MRNRTTIMSPTLVLLGLLAVLGGQVGCGDLQEERRVRVVAQAVREGEALELEDGSEDVDGDAEIERVLMRLGRLQLDTDTGALSMEQPLNLDLFEPTILLEMSTDAERVISLDLEVPAPEGDGVVRGSGASVFISGLLFEQPFEYFDASMAPLSLPVGATLGSDTLVLSLQIDIKELFHDIDEEALTMETNSTYLFDATHNTEAAANVETMLRAGISVTAGGLPCHDCDDDSP